jgi:hypothetical protein
MVNDEQGDISSEFWQRWEHKQQKATIKMRITRKKGF